MLDKIIRFSLQNRLFILMAAVLLMVGGIYTTYHMDVDVFPDLNAPTVVVMTEATGMAAEEVEKLVTFPVESAVNGATDVRRVRSSSTTGFSVVWGRIRLGDRYLQRQTDCLRETCRGKRILAADMRKTDIGTTVVHPRRGVHYRSHFGQNVDAGPPHHC